MKKTVVLLLILLMTVSCLGACSPKDKNDVLSDTGIDTAAPQMEQIELLRSGEKTNFTIIYPDDATEELMVGVSVFENRLNEVYEGIDIISKTALKRSYGKGWI